jgi:hypothetical protein
MKRSWSFTAARTAAVALAVALAGAAQASDAASLRARFEALQPQLAASQFKRPLVLESSGSSREPSGSVFAVVDHPFRTVSAALQRGEHWCDMMILQTNVKRCVSTGASPQQTLHLAVGRKNDQPAHEAFQVDVRCALKSATDDFLAVTMTADNGPLGTRDYKLTLEAVPLDARRTFVHMTYSYANGFAARLATEAYLATAGRNKVGFSVVGRDDNGEPIYVDGMRGVAERTTMRYFLAIDAFLDSLSAPPEQQVEKRLRQWFLATDRYPRQLREMDIDDYLTMKRREVKQQQVASSKTAGVL